MDGAAADAKPAPQPTPVRVAAERGRRAARRYVVRYSGDDGTTVLMCGADFKSVMPLACKASGCGFDSHSRLWSGPILRTMGYDGLPDVMG